MIINTLDLAGSAALTMLVFVSAIAARHVRCRFGQQALTILIATLAALLIIRFADVPFGVFHGQSRGLYAGIVYAAACVAMIEIGLSHVRLHRHMEHMHLEGSK